MKKFLAFTSTITFLISLLSCNNKKDEPTAFSVLEAGKTNITFENIPASNEKLNILYYIYYYNGAGVSTGDINNDGLADIYFASNNRGKNKLYLNKGNMEFEDITDKAGVAGNSDWCTGVTMADVNADGFLDIYVSTVNNKHGLTGRNELFINNGNGTFSESALIYGLGFSGYSTQAAFFDYDRDGDLDCYLLNQSDRPYQYIVDTSFRRKPDANAGDRFFRNDLNTAAKKFTDVSKEAGIYQSNLGYGLGLAIADFNNDGWDDVYIGNDFHENDYYYLNNGNGSFSESSAKAFNHFSRFSMGNDAADFNNDGRTDVITVDMLPPEEKILKTYGSDERIDIYNFKIINNGYQPQYSRNCLQQNLDNGKSFSDIGLAAGVSATDWSWSPLMADFNNDGNKDIFISSGIVKRPVDMDYVRFVSDLARQKAYNKSSSLDDEALQKMPEGSSICFLFQGNGNGEFKDKSKDWGIAHKKGFYTGAAYADLDNDGDLDMVVNPLQSKAFIYQNNLAPKHFLQLKFKGDGLNPFGIGAKAYVFQGDKMQYQQLMLTRGFQSSSYEVLHFGLDSTKAIDSLLIIWPDASFQIIKTLQSNRQITIDKSKASGEFEFGKYFEKKKEAFFPIPSMIANGWKHKEDPFDDFTVQYLIPHSMANRGPSMAVADVNGDGLDDLFVGGPAGIPGQLFIQALSGQFISGDTSDFFQDKQSEDVDAIFFDANGDNHPDLYVASGGNFYKSGNAALSDRLYFNDGKGNFSVSVNSLPAMLTNKSKVTTGDIDGDNDQDIFVGSLSEPEAYGQPLTSYLLLNDGKGKFSLAPESMIDLKNVGMVNSAVIGDFNKDGRNDLIVAGEWMSITIYLNDQNAFKPKVISETGLWQSLHMSDINGDGHPDILAGNWGMNSKLSAGKNGPLKLYVKDFDNNGKSESILAYTIDGKEYSFLPKDEIEQVLPVLKKNFLYHSDFAGRPLGEVLNIKEGQILALNAKELASSYFLNDGKGNFTQSKLPFEFQLSPLFAFQKAGSNQSFIAGGNFYGVLPYEGQYDAAALVCFESSGNKTPLIKNSSIIETRGQVRDLEWVRTKKGDVLIAGRNNNSPLFYGYEPVIATPKLAVLKAKGEK